MSSPAKLAAAKEKDAKLNPKPKAAAGSAKPAPAGKSALNKSKLVKGAKKIGNAVAGKKKKKATSPKAKRDKDKAGGETTPTTTTTTPTTENPAPTPTPAPEPEPEPEPAKKVEGKVKIRYNHYCEEVTITTTEGKADGSIPASEIVDLLALDFAFPGNFVTHLNTTAATERRDRLWYHPETGNISGLMIGKEYFCDIDEDEVAEAAVVRTAYKGAESSEPSMIGGKREEGCSCLFGNPCMEAYTCKNWAKREEIARANGWKGYS